ncbi:MAG: phage/plasmid primase, P4 family, partial [Candidatus Micrarchaeaceae archaeon]
MGLNIIPLERDKKTPAVNWKDYQTRHISQEEYDEWFGQDPNRNHAVLGGVTSNNLVVLDFEKWDDFVEFFPKWEELAKTTRVVKTPHGGAHVYYYTREEIQRRIKIFGDKHEVDVCGWGGYVCGVGTVIDHALCDKKKCHIAEGKSTYTVVGTMEIATSKKGFLEGVLQRGRQLGWEVDVIKDTKPEKDTFNHLLTVDGKLNRLWNGDTEGYPSRSEAEFALVMKLISYGFSDDQINSIMKESKIGKWNTSEQYAEFTLKKAHEWAVRDRATAADESPSLLGLGTPSDAADHILEHFRIITTNAGMYVYDENRGVYRPDMEKTIESWAEAQAHISGENISIHYVAEMFAHVQRRTYNSNITKNLNIINIKNGLLNVKTGEFIDHTPDPAYFSTAQIPVAYDPNAKCPAIMKFLSETVLPEDIPVIQEFVGYIFYNGYPKAAALLLVGGGSNGKSTFINLVKALLGTENISSCSVQELDSNHFSKADLVDKMANLYADLPDIPLKSTGTFKMASGGDPITIERKYGSRFIYLNTAKFIFSANKVPTAYDDTDAYYRRFIIIKFNKTFDASTADPYLLEKLTTPEELSGFLNWALEGLHRLMKNNFVFTNSKSVESIKDEYIRLSNPVEAFFMDMVEEDDPDAFITKMDLYQGYVSYCKKKKLVPLTIPSFFMNMKKNGRVYEEKKLVITKDGKKIQQNSFLHIKLKDATNGAIDSSQNVLPEPVETKIEPHADNVSADPSKPEDTSQPKSTIEPSTELDKPEDTLEVPEPEDASQEAPLTEPNENDLAPKTEPAPNQTENTSQKAPISTPFIPLSETPPIGHFRWPSEGVESPGFTKTTDSTGFVYYKCKGCGAVMREEYTKLHRCGAGI